MTSAYNTKSVEGLRFSDKVLRFPDFIILTHAGSFLNILTDMVTYYFANDCKVQPLPIVTLQIGRIAQVSTLYRTMARWMREVSK